ncbi:MAG TPA: glycosyltransferase family 4 protein, partial [Flavobacterium sp.]
MKIGFLTLEFPNSKAPASGGLGTSLVNLSKALKNEGVEVIIFMYGQDRDEVFQENGIEIHMIKARNFGKLTWYKYRKFVQNYVNTQIKAKNIDLIEAPDWTGITAFMNLNAPLVIRFHGSDAYFCKLENRQQKLKNFLFEKMGVRNAQGYIAPTDFAGTLSASIFRISKPVKTIHYGLQLTDFTNEHPRQFEKGLILHIGTIIRKKGVFELPEIFRKVHAQFPGARMVLIGPDANDHETGSRSTWELIEKSIDNSLKPFITYLG